MEKLYPALIFELDFERLLGSEKLCVDPHVLKSRMTVVFKFTNPWMHFDPVGGASWFLKALRSLKTSIFNFLCLV